VQAAAPVLYTQPAYESPVRGDPDDLLLLSGSGLSGADTVVYQATAAADAPYAVTIHLPEVMTPGGTYALWVINPDGEWSTPALINDARPLWITPDCAYQTASLANLPHQHHGGPRALRRCGEPAGVTGRRPIHIATPSAAKASTSAFTGAWQPKSTIVPAQSRTTRSKRSRRLMSQHL
jgi:hypothetical protein